MDLIIGGAYQGKLDYARARFGLTDGDVCVCTPDADPDTGKRCLCRIEDYVLRALRTGREPQLRFREDAVLICTDISGGVVPIDGETRRWREATGRLLMDLAGRADTVTRVFCGLPQRLK